MLICQVNDDLQNGSFQSQCLYSATESKTKNTKVGSIGKEGDVLGFEVVNLSAAEWCESKYQIQRRWIGIWLTTV